MKKLLKLLTNKIFVVGLIFISELALILFFAADLLFRYTWLYVLMMFISFFLVLWLVNKNDDPMYALAWSIVILVFPPFGAIIYLLVGGRQMPKKLREKISESYPYQVDDQDADILQEIHQIDPALHTQANFVYNTAHYPIYRNLNAEYLEIGERKFERMLEILEKAEKFIFLEYFIIKDGYMWQTTLEVLTRKVNEGVDVRLIYDDWGCAPFVELKKQCEAAGIKSVIFNPLVPRLAMQMNNRSHRKAVIVDGRYGIVGGINIADEYINRIVRFGHWKDTAVLIEGEAVYSLTLMFLQFYRYYTGIAENPESYKYDFGRVPEGNGYVQPFADAPTDGIDVGIEAHLNLINNAKEYLYIQTPYLIIGHEMIQALCIAAKRGVDVRILVPHIPDKKIVFQGTKSNYEVLLEHGVKIYEYTPGFVHSKTMVSDDKISIVGTTNMDFRSYYMHFECSLLFVDTQVVSACYEDFIKTLDVSHEVTYTEIRSTAFIVKLFRATVRIFSGLL
ncbi:cardiolipin synthase [Erysipelothrix larvae]|uniref:Cardiolipin synthase n=1 Tax=Erysipelothrix larvae TaxID=1514105 RepID=A0A109UGI8_9FIRM|nr:cardiolipin synthase [Erysipelothrix larvae]AMC92638.1 cardiolipin synthase [Erysipelothrix larvae]